MAVSVLLVQEQRSGVPAVLVQGKNLVVVSVELI